MDPFTRRIIGFGVHAGDVDGVALCRLFNTAISTQGIPHYLSSDNDPLFRYQRWQTNLRILDVKEIKSVPYIPLSHPFVETHRVHTSLDGDTPSETSGEVMICRADLNKFRWKAHCRGLFQLPVAA